MADQEKKVGAFIIRDFKNAGTEQRFEGGKIEQIEAGAFENYRKAGLVRTPTAEDRKANEDGKAKPAA